MSEKKMLNKIRRIKHISIKDLFGMFNHNVSIKSNKRIAIIIGPNGIGKTTLLEMTNGIFKGDYTKLKKIPFSTLEFLFDDETKLTITKKSIKKETNKEKKLDTYRKIINFQYINLKGTKQTYNLPFLRLEDMDFPIDFIIRKSLPFVKRVSKNTWLDQRTGEILDLDNIITNYSEIFESSFNEYEFLNSRRRIDGIIKYPKWLKELIKSVQIRFIQSQRLFKREFSDIRETLRLVESVVKYSSELVENIESARANYADVSQSFDRSFPNRLVKKLMNTKSKSDILSKKEIIVRLKNLEEQRISLMEVGLLERTEEQDDTFKIEDFSSISEDETGLKQALTLYTQDTKLKLDMFSEFANKIELFKEIINSRFLYKTLNIDKDKGFVFNLIKDKNRFLGLKDLSSGEQHVLVIQYELLFRTKPGSLILVDEPEISLHIDWQKRFIDDILRISEIADLNVIIATHSPQIIEDKWDLAIKLDG